MNSVDQVIEQEERTYLVPSVVRCFQILEAFRSRESDRGLSLNDLVTLTGIRKTTAFRILFTLEAARCVVKDSDSGKYRLGPGLFELAAKLFSKRGIIQVSRPHLTELKQKFNET